MDTQKKQLIELNILSEVLHSSAITSGFETKGSSHYDSRELHEVYPKSISFDLDPRNNLMVIGEDIILDIKQDNMTKTREDSLLVIENRLIEVLDNKGIEFIKQDPITKNVILFSEGYVDKLESKEAHIGTLILNHHRQWYNNKCGKGKKATREHHETFKTFSQKEISMLKHQYIPISVISKDILPIYNSIVSLMQFSPLTDYIETDIGYSVNGGRVDNSKAYWLPRIVAKEYLEETDDHKIFSSTVLRKLVKDAGLLGDPPVENHRLLSKEMFSRTDVKETTDEFIINKHNERKLDLASEDIIQQLISYDINKQD